MHDRKLMKSGNPESISNLSASPAVRNLPTARGLA